MELLSFHSSRQSVGRVWRATGASEAQKKPSENKQWMCSLFSRREAERRAELLSKALNGDESGSESGPIFDPAPLSLTAFNSYPQVKCERKTCGAITSLFTALVTCKEPLEEVLLSCWMNYEGTWGVFLRRSTPRVFLPPSQTNRKFWCWMLMPNVVWVSMNDIILWHHWWTSLSEHH